MLGSAGETVADHEDQKTEELDEGQAHQHGGLDLRLSFGVAADGFDGFTDADKRETQFFLSNIFIFYFLFRITEARDLRFTVRDRRDRREIAAFFRVATGHMLDRDLAFTRGDVSQ